VGEKVEFYLKKLGYVISIFLILGMFFVYRYMNESQASFNVLQRNNAEESTNESSTNSNGITNELTTNDAREETYLSEIILDVPLLNQMDHPRLYNGCEVTSLAMILNYWGINVTKNELANQISTVPLKYNNGLYGNPNVGFVGNMEDGPGLGVYHKPIMDLARSYVGDRAEDITNQSFDTLLKNVSEGHPVWVITTSTFSPISDFETWSTPQGFVDITYKMHSVVITGYDSEHVYFNNPYGTLNQKVDRTQFIAAWEQMGKQAIVIHQE
jgi:uncharacterized protein YvpB